MDISKELQTKNGISYTIGNKGIFKQVKNDFYTVVQKMEEVNFLSDIKESVSHIPICIPKDIMDMVLASFKELQVEENYLLYYNIKKDEWLVRRPSQKATPGHVSYEIDYEVPEEYTLYGSIHSHCNMAPFYSTTDDEDQLDFDGIHIVCGYVHTNPVWVARLTTNGVTTKKDVNEITNGQYNSYRSGGNRFLSNSTFSKGAEAGYINRWRCFNGEKFGSPDLQPEDDWDEQGVCDELDVPEIGESSPGVYWGQEDDYYDDDYIDFMRGQSHGEVLPAEESHGEYCDPSGE